MSLETLLSKYDYADVRIERTLESAIRITNDEVKSASGISNGVGVRVLEKGSWGFAACDGFDIDSDIGRGLDGTSSLSSIESLLSKAHRLAKLSSGSIKLARLVRLQNARLHGTRLHGSNACACQGDDLIPSLLSAGKDMRGKNIAVRTVSCTNLVSETEFCSSYGRHIIQSGGYAYLSCTAVAKSGGLIQKGSSRTWARIGGSGGRSGIGKIGKNGKPVKNDGLEKLDLSIAAESKEKALRLLGASPPPKGKFTVVLDPQMTGVFSHEAVGHACEADSIVDRESILRDKLGKRIGNELVTIVDDPTADDFGHYEYDSEGTKAKRTLLVDRGVLKGYLNSLETAEALGHEPNGHARADSYAAVPVVRMGNTYFQKGKTSHDDLFDVRNGVYLKGMRGGSVDIFSGGFMFKAEEAYEIKDGEVGKVMRDTTISGNILQTLRDVESVGKDFGTSPGICGKAGQEAPVSDGGPHIRMKDVAIG